MACPIARIRRHALPHDRPWQSKRVLKRVLELLLGGEGVVQDDIRNPADLDAWLAAHG